MSYRFAFSLAALERPTSSAAFPGLSPCWSTRLRPPNTTMDGGAASYIAFLSFGRPGKLPRGVLLHVSPHIGCRCLEIAYDYPEIAYGCQPLGPLNRQIAIGNLARDIVNIVRP